MDTDTAKIHCTDPKSDDHCFIFPQSGLRIPLKLNGIFSYFKSRKPLASKLHEKDKIFITPDSVEWNPNCPSFEHDEDAITDHKGYSTTKNRRLSEPVQLIDDPDTIFDLASVTATEWDTTIDANISDCHISNAIQDNVKLLRYDLDATFSDRLSLRGEISKFSASISSTIADNIACSIFTSPKTSTLDKLEYTFSALLDPDQLRPVISTVSAN